MTVVMLSATRRLHRPSDQHLVTACGLQLRDVTVGPLEALAAYGVDWCPDCFGGGPGRR